ncbi:MAG: argininosuccinate lyase, partial [Acinetobacter sp.]
MTTSSNSSNPSQTQTSGMWGGRFSEATDAFVAEFTASVQFDQRFYKPDIAGSIAHAT